MTAAYCRGANAIIIVYDVTDKKSFEHIKVWLEVINENTNNPIKLIIGNKCDLSNRKQVIEEDKTFLERQTGIDIIEISAKNRIKLTEAIEMITKKLIEKKGQESPSTITNNTEKPKILINELEYNINYRTNNDNSNKIKNVENKTEELYKKIINLKNECRIKDKKINELEDKIINLNNNKENELIIQDLINQINNLNKNKNELNKKLKELENNNKILLNENKDKEKNIQDLNEKNNKLNKDIKDLIKNNEDLKKINEDLIKIKIDKSKQNYDNVNDLIY